MFIYGSILIEVTFKPVVFNKSPVEDAIHVSEPVFRVSSSLTNYALADPAHNTSRHEDILHFHS